MVTCNLCGHTCHCSKDGMCMEKINASAYLVNMKKKKTKIKKPKKIKEKKRK